MIGNDPDYYFEHCLGSNGGTTLDAFAPEMLAEYRRCWRDTAMITASCSDYRAGSTIDLEHDDADITTKEIGREHVCTQVTNAHIVCRNMLEKKQRTKTKTEEPALKIQTIYNNIR